MGPSFVIQIERGTSGSLSTTWSQYFLTASWIRRSGLPMSKVGRKLTDGA